MGLGAAVSAVAGVASGVGSIVGGSNSSSAAKTAAQQQASADQAGAALATGTLGGIANVLTPYTNEGSTATNLLTGALSSDQTGTNYLGQSQGFLGEANSAYGNAGTALGTATGYNADAANIYGTLQNGISQQTLDNTPGYQFTLNQGLESTQNSAAARGLANSGAALKGAASYATGLANDTYQNQYNDLLSTAQGYGGLANSETGIASGLEGQGSGYTSDAGTSLNQQASLLDTNQQNYNQLLQGSQLGENAANAYGEYATTAAQTAAGLGATAGAATGSGTTGAASAYNNALTGATGSLTQSLLLNKLLGTNSSSNTSNATSGGVGYQFPTAGYSTGSYQ